MDPILKDSLIGWLSVLAVPVGILIGLWLEGLLEWRRARGQWQTLHPGVPYRRRWAHLRSDCSHDDPIGKRWVVRCDTAGISPDSSAERLNVAEFWKGLLRDDDPS